MKHFICYDIENDGWRDKLAKLLDKHGCKRVQKSVFMAVDFSPRETKQLRQAFEQLILPHLLATDSVLCLPVENDLAMQVVWHGINSDLHQALERPLTKLL
ncbi:MAG: CRISPR-associated endonuclease Cas2 [Saprospiraceae bacterium]|nr:CRISPR-associated endonuclease Cas2 [Saprospiraceae bacterium]MCF8249243.1 CRISPR-associated endonuclease Cas2 [Saprospiraceae bacterium]MCF8281189.1 CRISPR-associated endonuclease Cas2 [Bacteroidales bacterium]MCF8311480.1 CRISPR-associated endonuclease Cas2 [Saprospiraceae bacterium]MCF8439862.1 CRISPR-associated endonuclease Cas2 [Saprospiraceae bacterium]